jgi:DNA repair protein RadA/Sms
MAKSVTRFVCNNCGAQYSSWAGRCSQCGEWNTITEEVQITAVTGTGLGKKAGAGAKLKWNCHRQRKPDSRTAGNR